MRLFIWTLAFFAMSVSTKKMISSPVTINFYRMANGEVAVRSFSKSGSYKLGYSKGLAVGRSLGYKSGYAAGTAAEKRKSSRKVSSAYSRGYSNGKKYAYSRGYKNGKSAGYRSGYRKGHRNGKRVGYRSGYRIGKRNGYRSGHSVGYRKGRRRTRSCSYTHRYNVYLSGYPRSTGKRRYSSFSYAKKMCNKYSDCGGLTLNRQGRYWRWELRRGRRFYRSPSRERSYLKTRCY